MKTTQMTTEWRKKKEKTIKREKYRTAWKKKRKKLRKNCHLNSVNSEKY